jgi:hypothetical protein
MPQFSMDLKTGHQNTGKIQIPFKFVSGYQMVVPA